MAGKRKQSARLGRPPIADETADLTVRFPRADFDALTALTERDGVSAGALVREAVRRYVAQRRTGKAK